MNGFQGTEGRGVLFPEKNKKHEKAPDMKGELILSRDYKKGEKVKLAAWNKATKMGTLVSIAEDNWKPNVARQEKKYDYPREVNDSDIPF